MRKKHNIAKRHANYARALMGRMHACCMYITGQFNDAAIVIDVKNKRRIAVTPEIGRALTEVDYKWSIFCAVFGRRQDGQEYMKAASINTGIQCRQSDIADQLTDIHRQMVEEFNKNHLVGVGWIACPYGHDLDEKEAGEVFSHFGAWENESAEITV